MAGCHTRKCSSETYQTNLNQHVSRLSLLSQKLDSLETDPDSDKKRLHQNGSIVISPSKEEAIGHQLRYKRFGMDSSSPEDECLYDEVRENSGEQNTRDYLNQELQEDQL